MKNKKNIKTIIVISLLLIEVCLAHLTYKSFNNKKVELDEVKLINQENKNNSFAIMLNDGNGEYKESKDNKFPEQGYIYNAEKSGCIGINNKQIFGGGISYNQVTNQVTLRTNQKSYCYLYFDKKEKPVIDKFYINEEGTNKTTKEPEVTIHLQWSDPYITEYCISETEDITTCEWKQNNIQTKVTQSYTFTSQGSKTFYAYIKDIAKNISEVKSDSIEYKAPITGGSMVENPIDGVLEPTGVAQDELATRYYGTNPANYICIGTNDKSTCTGNQGIYMYRIIGVDKSGRYKVIKKEALDTVYAWHSSNNDTKWANAALKTNLNGSYFLTNSTYQLQTATPFDSSKKWADLIETMAWKYGDFTDNNKTAAQMIQIEQAWTTTTSAQIGLMYLADYYYAYQKVGLNCSSSGQQTTCVNSWMHLSKNDTGAPFAHEWTMSRYGSVIAWFVHSSGYVGNGYLNFTNSVRPVFYLKSNVEISGSGTESDPYLIIN